MVLQKMSVMLLSKVDLRNNFLNLRESSFLRNVLVVMSGTAASQIIGFALTPIISRLFSPSDFGIFGSFNAILTVITAGVTLDYTQAIMLPPQKEDAINLFMISCVSTIMITLCCLGVCLFTPTFFMNLMKVPNNFVLVLLVLGVLISGFNLTFQAWCIRVKEFKYTSTSQIIRSLSVNGTQVGLGFLRLGPLGLIFGVIFGELMASLKLFSVITRDLKELRQYIGCNRIKQLAKDYRDFPIYSASENVINALSAGLPVILLTHFYGATVAGAYIFGIRILRVPMRSVLVALRQVLFQKACESQNRGSRLLPLYIKTTLGLFGLALIPSAILFIWSPQLFSWVFGSQWQTAGEYARSLIVWLIFDFCNLPAVLFAKTIRVQKLIFFYNIFLLILRGLILILGGMHLNSLHTVMLFASVSAAMNTILIFGIGYVVMKKEGHTNQSCTLHYS